MRTTARLLAAALCAGALVAVARSARADTPVSEDALVAAARRLEEGVVEVRVRGAVVAWRHADGGRPGLDVVVAEGAKGGAGAGGTAAPDLFHFLSSKGVVLGASPGGQAFFVADGTLLTAAAVVEGAGRVDIRLADGRSAEAVVAGVDRDFGVALLRTSLSGPVLELDSSAELEAGRLLVTSTAQDGGVELTIVARRETQPGARGLARLARAAEGAAAGSPALGPDGRVRGMVVAAPRAFATASAQALQALARSMPAESPGATAVARQALLKAYAPDSQGMSYHDASGARTVTHVLPARRIARALAGLREEGRVKKAYLGIVLGAPPRAGAPLDERRVARLLPGSPAEGRLRPGDRIVAVAGRRLAAHDDLTYEILALEPGRAAVLTVERELEQEQQPDVETVDVEVVPTERTEDANARGGAVFGFEAVPLTPELKAWLSVAEDGLVVSAVTAGGAADRAGLRRGDRVVKVVGRDVATQADLVAAVDDALRRLAASEAVTVEVVREGQPVTVRLIGDAEEDAAARRRVPR